MQIILHFCVLALLLVPVSQIQAQKKVRFSQIDDPYFYMGEDKKQLESDYGHIVITLIETADYSTSSAEIQSRYSFLKENEIFEEYNSIIFSNSGSQSRSEWKKFFKEIQRLPSVSNITPYYSMDDTHLFYFNLLNYQLNPAVSRADIQTQLNKHNLHWLEKYESDYPGGVSFVRVPKGMSIFKISRKLNATGLFKYIYPMSNRIVSEDYTPNDTEYGDQWHLNQNNDADIDAPEAWNLTTGNSNLVIAIQELDGFDLTHPDLSQNVISPYNAFLDVYDAQFLDNVHTHGTRVAGCSSAVTDNNMGMSGVAFNLKVMPIILTAAASNSVNALTLQRAGDHIMANGNVVAVSNSWSGSSYDAAEDEQFQRMRTLSRGGLGSVILGSTGNYSNMQIRYPACYKNIVGVGRTTESDFRYSSSNYHDSVDVAAPGSNIPTLDIVGAVGAAGNYTTASGTSFSTPITAGVIGLMASINPNLTGQELKDYLEQSCEKVGNYPYYPYFGRSNGIWNNELGYGRVNAFYALLLADSTMQENNLCSLPLPLNPITSTQFCLQNVSLNGASQSLDPLNCNGETSVLGQDAWFEFTAVNSIMTVIVNPLGTGLDPVVAVYESCGGNLINCIDAAEGEGFSESLSLSGLIVNQSYYIRVYDFTVDGALPNSLNFDVCAFATGVTCATPSGLFTTSTNTTQANLEWVASSGGSSYEIALKPIGNVDWTAYSSSSNTLTANSLLCNTSYEWKVKTVCSNGNVSAWSSLFNFSTLDCTECIKPYNLTASNITTVSADLSWETTPPTCSIDGIDGEIFEGTASNGTSIGSWFDIGVNSFSSTGLQANTTYTYRVRQDCDCSTLVRSNYVYYSFTTPGNSSIDLAPSVSSSNLLVNGTSIDLTASFVNNGTADAANFEVAYYLSRSPYFYSYDYLIGSATILDLSAGNSKTEFFNLDFCNANIPDGEYYLGFYVDSKQDVTEALEVNNFWFWPDKPITLDCNAPVQYTLSLTAAGNTGATVNGGGIYNAGALATIQAFPATGWEFINWTENGVEFSTTSNSFVNMDSDKSLVANFGALTRINDVNQVLEFSVSPNPTKGFFTISLGEELKGAYCELYNLNGRLVANYILPKAKNEIAFDGASGLYFLQLFHPDHDTKQELLLKE